MLEINPIKWSESAPRFPEIENAAFASWAKHAKDFSQARIVVGEIAETESRRDQIKLIGGKRKIESIGFDPAGSGRIQSR